MNRILGLDLGTNSIGWAIVEKEWNHYLEEENFNLIDKGVRVFPEGYDKDSYGNDQSRAKQRTQKRGTRRLYFRRKLRKYELLKVLVSQDPKWCPLSKKALRKWRYYKNPDTGKTETFQHFPDDQDFLNWLKTEEPTNKNPYYFRDKFSRIKYNWEKDSAIAKELGRAFYHMAQRRGFLSNRLNKEDGTESEKKAAYMLSQLNDIETAAEFKNLVETEFGSIDKDDKDSDKELVRFKKYLQDKIESLEESEDESEEEIITDIKKYFQRKIGPVKKEIHKLTQEIKDANCDTLGQYFYKLYTSNQHERENKIRGRYTHREEHYKKEFNQICDIQKIDGGLRKKLHNAIFYQRPLKSQKGNVGKCRFEEDKPRCPKSHPGFEQRRAIEDINKIKYRRDDGKMKPLNEADKKQIWRLFFRKSKKHFEFGEIAKVLNKFHGKELAFNYKKQNYKTSIAGCPTAAGLMNLFGKDWQMNNYAKRSWIDILENPVWKTNLYNAYQQNAEQKHRFKKKRDYDNRSKNKYNRTEIISKKSVDETVQEVWHVLFSFDDKKKVKCFGEKKLGLNKEQATSFPAISVNRNYGSLSLKAIQNLLPFLQEGLIFTHAAFLAKIPDLLSDQIWKANKNNITKGVGEIIKNYGKNKQRNRLINSLISQFKDHPSNGKAGYRLDDDQKEVVLNKVKNSYGQKRFNAKTKSEQQQIIGSVEQKLKPLLKSGSFIKTKRLDEKIKSWLLRQDNLDLNREKLQNLYHPSAIEMYEEPKRKKDGHIYLGSPENSRINNPVVMRTLHQVKKVVNTLVKEDKIDEETTIHIEMARDINTANWRAAIKQYQDERRKEREQIEEILIELFKDEFQQTNYEPEEEDYKKIRAWSEQQEVQGEKLFSMIEDIKKPIKKYRLWKEQEGKCIYTGKQIGMADLFNPDKFEIEHTIPRSKSYDNSMENLTICDRDFNRNTKRNRIPSELDNHEEILQHIEGWKEKYQKYEEKIERTKWRSKTAQTKEKSDQAIQAKNKAILQRNYWKDKYKRFTMVDVPDSFKYKSITDTGFITKYARAYLASVFNRKKVHCVNGTLVDQFRKCWGLHEILEDEHGVEQFKKKDRTNHIHHCIDAIVIACMTMSKYNELAHAWKAGEYDESGYQNLVKQKNEIETTKPWDDFTYDMMQLQDEVLVSHYSKNNIGKQTKRKVRKRGKIVYTDKLKKDEQGNPIPVNGKRLQIEEVEDKTEGEDYFKKEVNDETRYYEFARYNNGDGPIVYERIPKYQEGETVRGSLHKETFYGKTKQPDRVEGKLQYDEDGNIKVKKDKKGNDQFIYVVRKELEELKDSEVEKIVDPVVRGKVKDAKTNKLITFSSSGANVKGKVWMNKEKGIEIKKVRLEAPVKNPLKIKEQKDKRSYKNGKKRHRWKENYYAETDGNVLMTLYSNGKTRDFELVNTFDFANRNNADKPLYPHYKEKILRGKKIQMPLMKRNGKGIVLKPGQMILFFEPDKEKQKDVLNSGAYTNRLYLLNGLSIQRIKRKSGKIDEYGVLTFTHHQEARKADDLKKLDYKPDGQFRLGEWKPTRKMNHNQFHALIEDIDFEISPIGKIRPL